MNDLLSGFSNIYKTIIEQLGEEIFVCDGTGKILFVNPASVEINRIDADNILGRNVKDLVREGFFSDSSTLHVLEKKEPVSVVQKLKDGRKILATGIPVFDDDGNISIVISTSKDVEAVNQLLNTIDSRDAEIESLREEVFAGSGFITSDRSTSELKDTIIRIAPLDMPILIHGDIGVAPGIAHHFHGDHPPVGCHDAPAAHLMGADGRNDDIVRLRLHNGPPCGKAVCR